MKYCKAFVSIIIFLTLSGCRKNSDVLNALDYKVKNEITAFLQIQLSLSREDDKIKIRSIVESLDYKNMFVLNDKKFNKLIFVQMDTSFVGNVRNAKDAKKAYVVFNMNTGEKILNAYILEVVPRNNDFTHLIDLLAAQKNNFSGQAIISSLTQHFIEERVYESGKLKSKSSRDKKIANTQVQSTASNGCIDWFMITTWYYADGSVAYRTEAYLYTTCSSCDQTTSVKRSNYNIAVDCISGNDGTFNQFNFLDIWLKVQDTCLRKIILQIIAPSLSGGNYLNANLTNPKVRDILGNRFFSIFGAYQPIQGWQSSFFDRDILFVEDYSIDKAARYKSSGGSYLSMYNQPDTIKINPNMGIDASQEFWASIILHEMTHSVLTRENINIQQPQHLTMLQSYTYFIQSALMSIYPHLAFEPRDAYSLSFGGLGDDLTNNNAFLSLISSYGFDNVQHSRYNYAYLYLQHETGNKGKRRCE